MVIMHCRGHGENTKLQTSLKHKGTGEEKCLRMTEVSSFLRLLGVQAFCITSSPRQMNEEHHYSLSNKLHPYCH